MKPDELRNMTREELQERERELGEELFNLRFQAATRRISNPLRLREARRDLARVKTILREDALGKYQLATRGPKEE